ncbi:hypothetical protein P43SY_012110 [Pythium insidiosum]|uniref:Lipase-like C-terminal domain-containing protein n=1 Tax=Pythium insidiosum TaxID=114742 RepID=A0AAD5Q4B1_PYTIN|nr:hypothetical protein P43SY_012110 [Pythium insidiosum]
MSATTKFPVVLIHGLLGYGLERPLWNMGVPYWPEKELMAVNPNHIIVDVGMVSSDHDRACEAFYQILGGRVDYGEDHAKAMQHARFGRTHEGKHRAWSEDQPVHLIGHSMGSTTAIELYQLICADAFGLGTNHRWVRSITCIAGPLTGATITHSFGLHGEKVEHWTAVHIMSVILGVFFKSYQRVPWLRGLFDLHMDQWAHLPLREIISTKGAINRSLDLAMYTCQPAMRIQRNRELKHMEKVHLMSITTSPHHFYSPRKEVGALALIVLLAVTRVPRWMPRWAKAPALKALVCLVLARLWWRRVRQLDYAKMPSLYPMWLLNRHRARTLDALFDGFDPSHWEHNDGVVNIQSMLRPWFPKPQELLGPAATASSSAPGIRSSASTVSLKSSASASSIANDSMARCASHISIDGFHRDMGDVLSDAEEDHETAAYRSPRPRFDKGRWYVYRVDRNHFAGTYGDAEAEDLYRSLFTMMIHEYERDPTPTTSRADRALHLDEPLPLKVRMAAYPRGDPAGHELHPADASSAEAASIG